MRHVMAASPWPMLLVSTMIVEACGLGIATTAAAWLISPSASRIKAPHDARALAPGGLWRSCGCGRSAARFATFAPRGVDADDGDAQRVVLVRSRRRRITVGEV